MNVAVEEGLCAAEKAVVVAKGSSNGVDALSAFMPSETRDEHRGPLGFAREDFVIGFAGRLVPDKGIRELQESWQRIRDEFPHARLAIAGEAEQRDTLPVEILESLKSDERIRMLGWYGDMPAFYRSIDVLVLPSWREGLPTVVLEAAAMQVPTVAARSVGCVDAVVDGHTGLLVGVCDPDGLTRALRIYLTDPEIRISHGRQARQRVLRDFRPEDVWRATLEEYELAIRNVAQGRPQTLWPRIVKRLIDVSVATVAIVLLSPLLLLIAIIIRLTIGSPVVFRQMRPGLDERVFNLFKFRTMRDAVDAAGNPLPDAERLTAVGRILRAASLDELPELWNVLRGEMSLVGPRPLLPQYLLRYSSFQRRRHEVKPGITGWAQVSGRNGLAWEEKFRRDVWYVDHRSTLLDLKILLRTLLVVFQRQGIASDGHATMPEFMGSESNNAAA